MTKTIDAGPANTVAETGWRARWPEWAGLAAGLWSLVYGILGLCWSLGWPGFPFGERDPSRELTLFAGAVPEIGGPIIAVLGLSGAVLAVAMARHGLPPAMRGPGVVFGWSCAVLLAVVIPDYRVLMMLAYLPIFLVGAPFGWPPVSYLDHLDWPTVNLMLLTFGGLLWLLAVVSYQRRSRLNCGNCGRGATTGAAWTTPASAARWGRWAVYVAVAVPVLYDLTRWAWALGWPLGLSQEMWEDGQREGMWLAGAILGLLGLAGAVLTHGLTHRWGEVFPRWMLGLAGKRVPIMLAVVPAGIVAVIVTSAGLMVVRQLIARGFSMDLWATVGPMALWPIWGVSLAAAALAYYLRRRGTCRRCGRG
ncbi:hypothetical protein [Amycolatopsis marina]|nr:hypothetical protein [Amycolatopsis marina]